MALVMLLISVFLLIIVLIVVYDIRKLSKSLSKKKFGTKKKDTWALGIGILGGILLIISLFMIYGTGSFNDQTGWMGDTIGGVTAPFVNGLAALLVYLALKEQIVANEIVLRQFEKQDSDLKLESLYKIELLSVDLDSILKDIELRAERMKVYYERERTKHFELNILKRTSSRVYSRIIDFERLSIYKGFKQFNIERDEWILYYNKLYRLFDYLPDFFDNLYQLHDRHVKDIFDQKMAIRKRLLDLMQMAVKYNEDFKTKNPLLNHLKSPLWSTVDNLVLMYHQTIDESFGPKGEMIKETDFDKVSQDVLFTFIREVIEIRRLKTNYDPLVHPLMEVSAGIRTDINLIRQRANEFSNNVEIEYKKLVIGYDKKESTVSEIKKIKEFIDTELKSMI